MSAEQKARLEEQATAVDEARAELGPERAAADKRSNDLADMMGQLLVYRRSATHVDSKAKGGGGVQQAAADTHCGHVVIQHASSCSSRAKS